jgi:uncharacterized protein
MEIITYSLHNGKSSSDQYYEDIAAFTGDVIRQIQKEIGEITGAYQASSACARRESPRSLPEYDLELLYLGVLWQIYMNEDYSLDGLDRLIAWLGKSSRFEQVVKRLDPWRETLYGMDRCESNSTIDKIITLADWFTSHSLEVLGGYTTNVDWFLAEVFSSYQGRDDEVLCGRRRVEYHLNMVGTEIMNQAFRPAFLAAERKVVVLPACMKARPDEDCLADGTPFGARCAQCTPGCHVQAVTQWGVEHGFDVTILPEDLGVFRGGAGEVARAGSIGIVGVSCVLTNVDGGWQMRDLGVPAQGLLLDYCGCSYHWHPRGIATDINKRQLLRLLGEEI